MKKNPQQTEATRRNIKTAYYQMLSERQNITVDKLCKRAGYNRCTFYRYYADTNQLLEEVERDFAKTIRCNVSEMLDKQNLEEFIHSLVDFYEKNGDIVCVLLEKNPEFIQIMKEEMAPILKKHCKVNEDIDENFVLSLVATVISQTLLEWYRTSRRLPMDKVSKFIIETLKNGILR